MFLKAGTVLKKRGLAKGDFSERGRLCLYGAVRCAAGARPSDYLHPIDIMVGDYIGRVLDKPFSYQITNWNDEPTRTKAEVIAALDAAAVVALQEEGLEPEDVL